MYSKLLKTLFLSLSLLSTAYAEGPVQKTTSDTAIQNEILVQVNQYRHHRGLSALKMDAHITQEAKKHSLDMAQHKLPFGHHYFMSRIDRLHQSIKNSNAGAENVAYNYKDAQDVVKNWIKSPGHRVNIEGNYNLTGIGIARDKRGKIYFTQIFLRTGSGATRSLFPF